MKAVVVGGGHNGLVAAAYLARAGVDVTVLERASMLGGAARSEETWPGYTVSTASYVCSLLDPRVIDDLELRAHGFSAYRKDPSSFTPLDDGRSLLLSSDDAVNAQEIGRFSHADIAGFAAFEREAETIGATLYERLGDDIPSLSRVDETTRAWYATDVASFVERFVQTPVLAATLCTDGLIGTYAGPRDPGTAYVFAHHYAGRALGGQGAWGFVRGGMGAISNAAAASARAAGALLYTDADVARIVRAGSGWRVECVDGRTFDANVVLSNADPVETFARLCADERDAEPLRERLRTWRTEGVSFKINLALGELPNFTARPGTNVQPHHRATIHVAPDIAYLQRAHDDARERGVSRAPMLECFMQTPTDPTLAPPGKHILSIFAQYYPYTHAKRWSTDEKTAHVRNIIETLARYAPNLPDIIEEWDVLAPPDIETRIGITGGHIFHGELLPGQIFEDRFAVETPLDGLYLCGSGTHPGGCVSGLPGRRAATAVLARAGATV